jgi:protein ImuB
MTRIPSYEDLTPSIPDVSPGEVFGAVERLLPAGGPVAARDPVAASPGSGLFAALHGRDAAALAAIAREFSPRIQRCGACDVVLDVAGLARLLGDPHTIGAELSRAGAPAVAVAPTQVAARLFARARSGLTVADGPVEQALGPVPLAILRQLAADDLPAALAAVERAFDVLRRWGLTTLGEFAALPAGELSARLGQAGIALQRLARGIDARPLVPDPAVPRFVQRLELDWPIDALEPLSFVFARLLDPLAAALERADRGAAAIRLDLRLTDRTTHARLLPLPAAMRDPRVLRTLLLLDLESHPPPAAIDVVTIEADPAPARIVQYSLLERALPSAETLATLNARLGALLGEARCGSPALLDTHRPDGFAMRRFAAEPVKTAGRPPDPPAASAEAVTAAGACLRRFRPPVAIRVTLDGGRPVRVAIDRQGMPGGAVTQAAGPWRSSGAWWEPARWNRDEWDVALAEGAVCRLFRDRDSGVWFLEGIFD